MQTLSPAPEKCRVGRLSQAQARMLGVWEWLKAITGTDDTFKGITLPMNSDSMNSVRAAMRRVLRTAQLRRKFDDMAEGKSGAIRHDS